MTEEIYGDLTLRSIRIINVVHLLSIEKRLNNTKLPKIEKSQRNVFIDIVRRWKGKALSISCGDGIWDYLLFKNNQNVNKIIATDIIECPVLKSDQQLLRKMGDWTFVKVEPRGLLPFEDNCFDFVFHQDVIEHTEMPYGFLKEQYRVLRKGGNILVGTPNLFRPANVLKLIVGRLKFPIKIGFNEEVGDYIHVQEFHEYQLRLLLQEVGFTNINVRHCFFGISFTKICFSMYPSSDFGRLLSHFLIFIGEK